jgi:predicted TIM-barrel fold metal-dependent hydrolase
VIVDLNAWVGRWPFHPVAGDLNLVRHSLKQAGVEQIFASPLGAVWCRHPHRYNEMLYRGASTTDDVWPVPLLDPTIATWRNELDRASKETRVRLVKLVPRTSPYELPDADELMDALEDEGLGVIVQTRMEDPRRHHPLARVDDLPMEGIIETAERHPDLTVIAGGPRPGEILALRERLLDLKNCYADVSQSDGVDAVKRMVDAGLTEKLVFGSHAPMFIAHSAVCRVVADLDDDSARAILKGNATGLLEGLG